MPSDEFPLSGGTHGPVVRLGDTVRREARPSTATVHALLRHLESVGFDGAPRALGFDERGREILSFIPGDVGVRIAGTPAPAVTRTERTMHAVGQLLRRYHDATLGFAPPLGAVWASLVGAPTGGDVICHNDIGPYNTVFVGGEPSAFIDWDGVAPGPRLWDVAYAAYRFVPFVPDEICRLIGWDTPPNRPTRLHLLLEGYGMFKLEETLKMMERRVQAIIDTGLVRYAARDFADLPTQEKWPRIILPRLRRDLGFIGACQSGAA